MDILIGTKNQYKATEIVSFLDNISGVKIHFWEELGLEVKVEEDQSSLVKNAEKKAIEISKLTDWYVLASDGGVEIPGLGNKWDVLKNQRTVGEEKTDIEKVKKLLDLMEGLRGEKRIANYRLALGLAIKGILIWSDEKYTDKGYIAEEVVDWEIPPYRWMGHLWLYPKYNKVFNKLCEYEKNDVRKQGAVLMRSLRKAIRELLETNKD